MFNLACGCYEYIPNQKKDIKMLHADRNTRKLETN